VAHLDSEGLLVEDEDELAWTPALANAVGLEGGAPLPKVVDALKPTAIIGAFAPSGVLREDVVRTLASHVERPAVILLQAPGDPAGVHAEEVRGWSEGRALVATVGPGEPEEKGDGIRRGTSALAFPGIGLGAVVGEAREVTDGMLAAAARELARQTPDDDLGRGVLFPPVSRLREISARVAQAVVEQARREGLARNPPRDAAAAVAAAMWEPAYPVVEVI
jgi:malate dehydrogenase (oxaloacetate-decarboxylating)